MPTALKSAVKRIVMSSTPDEALHVCLQALEQEHGLEAGLMNHALMFLQLPSANHGHHAAVI